MKRRSALTLTQLIHTLKNSLAKEKITWQPHCYGSVLNTEKEVGPHQRDEVVCWMFNLNSRFGFNPETLMSGVTILDSFLHVVKAQPKYLRCIAITSLFLAAKISEEDEAIPTTQYLVDASHCGCTASDVLRMEKIILSKLKWDLHKVTALDFLHTLHAILLYYQPLLLSSFRHMTYGRQLTMLTQKLLFCEECCEITSFAPSTRALALLSMELSLCTRNWLPITLMLQQMVQVDDLELSQCRDVISAMLPNHIMSRSANGFYLRSEITSPQCSLKATKRKVEQIEEDDIYDSIKRLYGEEGLLENKMTCSTQAAQDEAILPLPALTAVRAL